MRQTAIALYIVLASPALARGGYDRGPIGQITAVIVVVIILIALSFSMADSVRRYGFPRGIFKHPVFGAIVGYILLLLAGAAFFFLLLAVKRGYFP